MKQDTNRWKVLVMASVLLLGLGIMKEDLVLAVSSVIPLVFVGYGELTVAPSPRVSVERRLEFESVAPGMEVDVVVMVTNEGDDALVDLRVVDSVPEGLRVVDGEPVSLVSLRAGESAEFRYTVLSRRGEYVFDEPEIRTRNMSGSVEVVEKVDEVRKLVCRYPFGEPPVSNQTFLAGAVSSHRGGEGVEFHSLRDYRRGDSLSSIDWRRYAKTGVLSTVQYHDERLVDVCVVVDARAMCFRSEREGYPDAVEYSAFAAERIYSAVRNKGGGASLALLPVETDLLGSRHVSGEEASDVLHRELLALRESLGVSSTEDMELLLSRERMRSWVIDIEDFAFGLDSGLDSRVMVVFISGLLDDDAVGFVESLRGLGRDVLVVSPDVTDSGSHGAFIESAWRERRLDRVGSIAGLVDWDTDMYLEEAFGYSGGGVDL